MTIIADQAYSVPDTLPTTEVLDLLAAIREALVVPFPAVGSEREHAWLLTDRASAVRAIIANIQDGHLDRVITAQWWAEYMRKDVENLPATYPAHKAQAAETCQAAEYDETPQAVA